MGYNSWSFDWDNFNSQHSNDDQHAVFGTLCQLVASMEDYENTPDGLITYLKATRWLAESFHNAWLVNMPLKEDLQDLLKEQNKVCKYKQLRELVVNTNETAENIAWSGLMKRTTKDGIHMKRGLRSGERNTDLTNTLLNRT